MKESRFVLTILLMLCIVMGLSLTGCSHDHDASPADSTNERLLTYEEQMAKIQRLQEEILDDLPMSRIQEIHDIIRYADSVYLDATSIAYGDLDEWYRTRLRIVTSELSTSATEDTITYFYERVFDADNFTGIFTYDKAAKRWTHVSAPYMQFNFEDAEGKACTLELRTSGNKRRMLYNQAVINHGRDDSGRDNVTNTVNYVTVPAQCTVSLTRGGEQLMAVTITNIFDSYGTSDTDLASNGLDQTKVVTIGSDFRATRHTYVKAGEVSTLDYTLEDDDKTIVHLTTSGLATFAQPQGLRLGYTHVELDLYSGAQYRGTISDLSDFIAQMVTIYDEKTSANDRKAAISQLNSLTKIDVYYNGWSLRQASLDFRTDAPDRAFVSPAYTTTDGKVFLSYSKSADYLLISLLCNDYSLWDTLRYKYAEKY